ncbi:hypothetical protein BT67DRAFT_107752 [Trichocladium antarcticum]|uniref:Uncharacterized protein n=1 Tax=Trichocladium antarcticum TaxID=1450529 RepID=A0AAN6UQL2_9PEZI|nr:hypothetical protein BT67DRAFT_107752 [Trichocladium antarcticum]
MSSDKAGCSRGRGRRVPGLPKCNLMAPSTHTIETTRSRNHHLASRVRAGAFISTPTSVRQREAGRTLSLGRIPGLTPRSPPLGSKRRPAPETRSKRSVRLASHWPNPLVRNSHQPTGGPHAEMLRDRHQASAPRFRESSQCWTPPQAASAAQTLGQWTREEKRRRLAASPVSIQSRPHDEVMDRTQRGAALVAGKCLGWLPVEPIIDCGNTLLDSIIKRGSQRPHDSQ